MSLENPTTTFSVDLTTPLGPIRGKVEVDPGPMRLRDLVPTAYELTNILVERAIQREEKEGRRISCRSGCGICCCQMVPLSPPEVFYLIDRMERFDTSRRQEWLGRFETIAEELEKQRMLGPLLDPEYSDEPVLSIAREYFSLKRVCPFLVDQSCSIYDDRPVACREYNVTSPAAGCVNPYTYEVVKVPMPLPLSAPLAILTAERTGSKPRLIPLTLAFHWAANHTDLRQRQWPGLELFHHFMDVLGRTHEQWPSG
jgi:Fe-S-cluster containining protein